MAFGLESKVPKLDVTEYVDPMKVVLSKGKRYQKDGWLLKLELAYMVLRVLISIVKVLGKLSFISDGCIFDVL